MSEENPPTERPDLRVVEPGEASGAGFQLGRDSSEPRDLRRFPPKVRIAIRLDLRYRALELRVGGASLRAIARGLNCSLTSAHRYVTSALEERAKVDVPNVNHYREIQLERIRSAILAIWPAMTRGDGEAVRNLVRLVNAESILTGTRAPLKIDYKDEFVKIGKELGMSGAEAVDLAEQIMAEDRANR